MAEGHKCGVVNPGQALLHGTSKGSACGDYGDRMLRQEAGDVRVEWQGEMR